MECKSRIIPLLIFGTVLLMTVTSGCSVEEMEESVMEPADKTEVVEVRAKLDAEPEVEPDIPKKVTQIKEIAEEAILPESAEIVASRVKVEPVMLFDFEDDPQGWEIPDWALEKDDLVAQQIALSDLYSQTGSSSLEVDVDFPGGRWTASVVEVMEYFDWSPYSTISVDVYLPEDAPDGLKGRIILTVGEDWKWTEMSRSISLFPGEWRTISADLTPASRDWKRTQPTDYFRADVRKMVVRIESNMKPAYTGPIYIDNIRVE